MKNHPEKSKINVAIVLVEDSFWFWLTSAVFIAGYCIIVCTIIRA